MSLKRLALILCAAALVLPLGSCGLTNREKDGNMEFAYDKETDTYTLAYYTDTSLVKELIVPDTFKGKKVTAIGQLAIASCDALEKVVIGKNIERIDKWGVVDCRYLKRIEVHGENEYFCSLDGVLYSKDMTKLVTYPNAHTAAYAKDGKLLQAAQYAVAPGTKVIGHCAFYKCYGLGGVVLPDSVEVIEDRAFHKCDALADIAFPEGLRVIGKDAFLGCEGFAHVALPSTITKIGDYAFYNAKNVKTVRVKAAQENVELGNKWYPTSAGRDVAVEIIWDQEGAR